MPSSTPNQARFMSAVAHGWRPSGIKAPPVAVAKEFNQADTGSSMLRQGMSGQRSPAQRKMAAIVMAIRQRKAA